MLQALGFRLLDASGAELPRGGAALAKLAKIERGPAVASLDGCEFRIACDVSNPLCGPKGAGAVFGPQKGATPAMVEELDSALARFAEVSGGDADYPGSGAAGGLGFAFRMLGAKRMSGAEWLKVFEEADGLGISFILLAGGEPLLRRDIIETAGKIRNIIFPIFTNGTFMDVRYFELFDSSRNLIPVMSIEGGKSATDERRGAGVYTRQIANMDEIDFMTMLMECRIIQAS